MGVPIVSVTHVSEVVWKFCGERARCRTRDRARSTQPPRYYVLCPTSYLPVNISYQFEYSIYVFMIALVPNYHNYQNVMKLVNHILVERSANLLFILPNKKDIQMMRSQCAIHYQIFREIFSSLNFQSCLPWLCPGGGYQSALFICRHPCHCQFCQIWNQGPSDPHPRASSHH